MSLNNKETFRLIKNEVIEIWKHFYNIFRYFLNSNFVEYIKRKNSEKNKWNKKIFYYIFLSLISLIFIFFMFSMNNVSSWLWGIWAWILWFLILVMMLICWIISFILSVNYIVFFRDLIISFLLIFWMLILLSWLRVI